MIEITTEMMEKAKAFALEKHGVQGHGCLTIKDHLTAVTGKLSDYWYGICDLSDIDLYTIHRQSYRLQYCAAWLHDVLEDTDTTYDHLLVEFGHDIANIVAAVTDGEGNTRTERHLNTYWRTRNNKNAIAVKLFDRWHNQKRTIENKEIRFAKEYEREYTYFKFALWQPSKMWAALWQELDDQHAAMQLMMDNQMTFRPGEFSLIQDYHLRGDLICPKQIETGV